MAEPYPRPGFAEERGPSLQIVIAPPPVGMLTPLPVPTEDPLWRELLAGAGASPDLPCPVDLDAALAWLAPADLVELFWLRVLDDEPSPFSVADDIEPPASWFAEIMTPPAADSTTPRQSWGIS